MITEDIVYDSDGIEVESDDGDESSISSDDHDHAVDSLYENEGKKEAPPPPPRKSTKTVPAPNPRPNRAVKAALPKKSHYAQL